MLLIKSTNLIDRLIFPRTINEDPTTFSYDKIVQQIRNSSNNLEIKNLYKKLAKYSNISIFSNQSTIDEFADFMYIVAKHFKFAIKEINTSIFTNISEKKLFDGIIIEIQIFICSYINNLLLILIFYIIHNKLYKLIF